MARNCAKERWGEGGFYMEQPDHEDESLSLCDFPLNLIKDDNPQFLFEKKPRAVETPVAAAADDDEEFDFSSFGGFSNSAAQTPPRMCLADEVFYQGQLLPLRLSVSSDNSSAGFNRRHGSGCGSVGKFRSINSSGSSSSRSQCSSSTVSNNSITSTCAARNSRPRVPSLFHSHPSPRPQIKASPTTFRQASTGGSQRTSSTWDFFRLGVVKAPGMELQDLKHRSSTRRKSSVSRSNSGGGILGGVGCKCSVESTVAPAPAMAIREKATREMRVKKKVQKEKEQQEKLALSRHRTFEWLKGLSHATFP